MAKFNKEKLLDNIYKAKNISSTDTLDKLKTAYNVHLKNNKLKNEFTKVVTISSEQRTIIKAIYKKKIKVLCIKNEAKSGYIQTQTFKYPLSQLLINIKNTKNIKIKVNDKWKA